MRVKFKRSILACPIQGLIVKVRIKSSCEDFIDTLKVNQRYTFKLLMCMPPKRSDCLPDSVVVQLPSLVLLWYPSRQSKVEDRATRDLGPGYIRDVFWAVQSH